MLQLVTLVQQVNQNKWIKSVVLHHIWRQRFGVEMDILAQMWTYGHVVLSLLQCCPASSHGQRRSMTIQIINYGKKERR